MEIKRIIYKNGAVLRYYGGSDIKEIIKGPVVEHISVNSAITSEKTRKSLPTKISNVDPTIIAPKLVVEGRNISKPQRISGSSRHQRQRVIVKNGVAHADKGDVFIED
jgi:hypothetical protein